MPFQGCFDVYKQGLILFGFASDLYQICAEDTAADLQALTEKIKKLIFSLIMERFLFFVPKMCLKSKNHSI